MLFLCLYIYELYSSRIISNLTNRDIDKNEGDKRRVDGTEFIAQINAFGKPIGVNSVNDQFEEV